MTPDPTGISLADLTDPQTLNQYSYVRNNPLRYVDPFGTNSADEDACGSNFDCANDSVPACPVNICVTTNWLIAPFSDNDFSTLPIWGITSFGSSRQPLGLRRVARLFFRS